MALQENPILSSGVVAAGAITKHRFVKWDLTQAGATANTRGVAAHTAASGESLTIHEDGIVLVEYGASTTAGDKLMTDSSGKAVTQTSTNPTVARCIDAASGDGFIGRARLIPN